MVRDILLRGDAGTALCSPGELRGPHLGPLFIASQDDLVYSSINFHPDHIQVQEKQSWKKHIISVFIT